MKKNSTNMITCGVLLFILGIIMAGNLGDYWNISIFNLLFRKGFWTFFIIAPCAVNIFQKGVHVAYITGIIISGIIWAGKMEFYNASHLKRMILPILLVIVGISYFTTFFDKSDEDETPEAPIEDAAGKADYTANFGTRVINYDNRLFNGGHMSSCFGEIRMDLSKAKFPEEPVNITCNATVGNIDIHTPENSRVILKKRAFLGGIHDYKKGTLASDDAPTFYIDATTIFGGIDIR